MKLILRISSALTLSAILGSSFAQNVDEGGAAEGEILEFWNRLIQELPSVPTNAPTRSSTTPPPSPSPTQPAPSPTVLVQPTTPPATEAPTLTSTTPPPSPSPTPPLAPPSMIPTLQPTPPTTAAPTTPQPTGPPIQLCSDNIPLTVELGPRSNPEGGFVNVALEQSLENVIDCLEINEGEVHTQTSHVWWNPAPLDLLFDFGGPVFEVSEVYFWNYFGETYDVDEIAFVFYLGDSPVLNFTAFPRLGENPDGANTNPIVAETIDLPQTVRATRVDALLESSNGQIDFQNFVFGGSQVSSGT